MRQHPLAPKRPSTLTVPGPAKPVSPDFPEKHDEIRERIERSEHEPTAVKRHGSQPAFDIPVEGEPTTLDSLVALSKNGATVPMPVARSMTDKEQAAIRSGQAPSARLTKLERDTLTKLGWQEGEPIPPDLSVELKNAFSDYVAQKQAEGIPLDQIKISRIEDLPESEQIRVRAVMRAMIEKEKTQQTAAATAAARMEPLAAYPDSVRQVLAGVDLTPSVRPDAVPMPPPPTENGRPLTAFPESVKQALTENAGQKTVPPPQPAEPDVKPAPARQEISVTTCQTCGRDPYREKQRIVCTHCGGDPLDGPDMEKISLDDKRRFLIALGTKKPFEKEYTIFHDTIKVRFRTLRAREFEELSLWAIRTVAKEKLLLPEDMMPRVQYMELLGSVVLQTRFLRSTLEGAELFWAAPDVPYPTLGDWNVSSMDELVDHFMEEVPSEAVIVALQHHLTKFNQLDFRLSKEANNTTNFWRET